MPRFLETNGFGFDLQNFSEQIQVYLIRNILSIGLSFFLFLFSQGNIFLFTLNRHNLIHFLLQNRDNG